MANTPNPAAATRDAPYSLASLNTFGFDVHAHQLIDIQSEAQLQSLVTLPSVKSRPCLVLGGGSNMVLTRDWPGIVMRIRIMGRRVISGSVVGMARNPVEPAGTRAAPAGVVDVLVEAGAGESWPDFVEWTIAQGLPGLENLALIPGTVGAAPVQNIGAYGLELADRFHSLRAVDVATGKAVDFDRTACRFGYRDSVFKQEGRGRYIITSVTFRLPAAWKPHIGYADLSRALTARGTIGTVTPRDVFDAVVAVRQAKLPDPSRIGNAGSFFKNPVVSGTQHAALRQQYPDIVAYAQADGQVKLAAAWLIDQCGWKGKTFGRAAVHDNQALVLTNPGGATGREILALAAAIQRDVLAAYGVALEIEPVVI